VAAKAEKWQEALDAYKRAAAVQLTKEAQDGIALATQKLTAEQGAKVAYDKAIAEARVAAKAEKWQEALDAYKRAAVTQSTKEAQDGITLATQKLAAEKSKRAAYDSALTDAKDAMKRGDYKAAADAIAKALSVIPDGAEAKALRTELGPTLTVSAELEGKELHGAFIIIDGNAQKPTTPATFRLKKGQSYKVSVTPFLPVPPSPTLTTDTKVIEPNQDVSMEFRAKIMRAKVTPPVDPPTRPVIKPGPVTPTPRPTPPIRPTPTPPPPIRPVLPPPPEPVLPPKPAPTSKPTTSPVTQPATVPTRPIRAPR
jgi:hypothetical protein